MASGFYALFDDIATLLDDVASMSKDVASVSKVAGRKTTGILGDDLAVNAEKASGFSASREIPILWKIGKGSFLNKLIILPIIFLLSTFIPWSITPILIIGGTYLAYEGAEKIYEFFFHSKNNGVNQKKILKTEEEVIAYEKKKIKSAIFVDFILSIEIIIISLSAVLDEDLITQVMAVSIVAIIATIGVYTIVAFIVRLDDFGFKLIKLNKNKRRSFAKSIGLFLVNALPYIIKSLNVIGTVAMTLVAGGIYHHHIHFLQDLFITWPSILSEFIIGLSVGVFSLSIVILVFWSFNRLKKQTK